MSKKRTKKSKSRKKSVVGRPGSNRGKTYPVETLSEDEANSLMKSCSNRAPTGIRNRALIVVLYRGGLRITEALTLAPKDLNLKAGTIRVLRGKGRKARTVAMDPEGAPRSMTPSNRGQANTQTEHD